MRKFLVAVIVAGSLLAGATAPALAMTVDPPERSKVQDPCIANPPPTNQGTSIAKPLSPALGGKCP